MFGKILKTIGKGILKALPLSGFINDFKLLRLNNFGKKISEGMKDGVSDEAIKKNVYILLDLLDDGKINNSFDKQILERILQLIVSLAAIATTISYLL